MTNTYFEQAGNYLFKLRKQNNKTRNKNKQSRLSTINDSCLKNEEN